jgi:hypothetical protein
MPNVIKETEKSRVGSTIGGTLALSRTFYVQVTTQGDDPVKLLQFGFGDRSGQGLGGEKNHPGVPVGSSHPWNSFATAQTYAIQDRIGVFGFLIRVDYAIITLPDRPDEFTGAWEMSFRSATIPRRLIQELKIPSQPQNPDPKYSTGRIYGANKYKERDPTADPPQPDSTHTATISSRGIPSVVVPLIQLDAREQTGTDAPIPAASMVLSRKQKNWNTSNVGSIVPYKHTVNANTFFGAPPGHIEFVDWSIDSEVVPDLGVGPDRDGERIMVIEHSFSLSFFFAGIRLDQESILHTYESDDAGDFPPP